jgi:hypothetical protein
VLSENVKIRIYKTIIFLVVLYGFETVSLILREEHRLRVFENRALKGGKEKEDRDNYMMRSFITCTPSQIFRVIKTRRIR